MAILNYSTIPWLACLMFYLTTLTKIHEELKQFNEEIKIVKAVATISIISFLDRGQKHKPKRIDG